MSTKNLALLFAPSLFQTNGKGQQEVKVMEDLIDNYVHIFDVSLGLLPLYHYTFVLCVFYYSFSFTLDWWRPGVTDGLGGQFDYYLAGCEGTTVLTTHPFCIVLSRYIDNISYQGQVTRTILWIGPCRHFTTDHLYYKNLTRFSTFPWEMADLICFLSKLAPSWNVFLLS